MKQNFSVVFYASILFLLTNGFYLVKNVVLKTMIPIDMIPLYMMVAASLAMLAFVTAYKDYGSQLARFGLLAFYTVVIAGVTVFMVSCNYHNIGLSISMCYLFVIMVAPTYQALDTAIVCLLIAVSWWLPGRLPYAENYDLFKHFLLRFSIVAGFISIRHIFIRQSANERSVKGDEQRLRQACLQRRDDGDAEQKGAGDLLRVCRRKLTPERVSVIIYDVDDFKSYNDHYSHMKGDEALKRVAGSVVRVLERSDRYLFRFGGEEFVVVLPDAAEDEACRIAGELLEAVRAAAIPRNDLPDKSVVTASFGVACGSSKELSDLSVITKADQQLYICKNGGKDCVAAGDVIYRVRAGGFVVCGDFAAGGRRADDLKGILLLLLCFLRPISESKRPNPKVFPIRNADLLQLLWPSRAKTCLKRSDVSDA